MKFIKENKVVIILLFIVLIPLFTLFQEDKATNWNLSLKPEEKKPFGTFVFDTLMQSRFKNRYQNTNLTLYEIHLANSRSKTIIILSDYLDLPKEDVEEIIKNAKDGNRYIIAANNFNQTICEKFDFEYRNYGGINPFWNQTTADTLGFLIKIHDQNRSEIDSVKVEFGVVNSYFVKTKTNSKTLLSSYSDPIAIENPYNNGSVTICTSPYFFTNYVLLNNNCWKLADRLLLNTDTQELYFARKYLINEKNQASIFKNILYNNALRYMLYLSLCLILIFMIFSAKRKQRIIPIIKQHKNNSLEFIKLIGRLYFLKKNHSDVCIKKFHYLKDYLSRTYQINFNTEETQNLYQKISIKTGIPLEDVGNLFRKMEKISSTKVILNKTTLHELVEEMEKFYIKK
jgi:hypothetical protein